MNNINSKSGVNNNYKEENIINNKYTSLITPNYSLQPNEINPSQQNISFSNPHSLVNDSEYVIELPPRTLALDKYSIPKKGSNKKDKLDPVWKKDVVKFQDKGLYCYKGQNIKDALDCLKFDYQGINPAIVVSTLLAILNAFKASNNEPGVCHHIISATALWVFTSPYKAIIYKTNKHVQSFVAQTISKALNILNEQDIIMYKLYDVDGKKTAYAEGRPRNIAVNLEFIDTLNQVIVKRFVEMIEHNQGFVDNTYRMKPATKGENLASRDTSEITLKVVQKLKTMQFRFNTDALAIDILATLDHMGKDKSKAIDNLAYNLAGINITTNEPQYFPEFHRQDSGRLHTANGAIGLSKEYRKLFIKPLNPDNILVDADLACAQLLILCDLLELPTLKIKLLSLLHQSKDNSIWAYIAPKTELPKAAKKIIVYSFCFGAELHHLPHIVTKKLKKYGIKFKIDAYHIDAALKGVLNPLVEARDKFINQYTLAKINSKAIPKLIDHNNLGHSFNIVKKAQDYMTEGGYTTLVQNKIGAQLLAFLAQGNEQAIIQPLILNCPYNIVAFQYDGFTYEVAPQDYEASVKLLTDLCPNPLSFEIL